jgi:transcriptional regulator with XRE-family HTH domain
MLVEKVYKMRSIVFHAPVSILGLPVAGKSMKVSEEMKRKMREMRRQGISYREIAKKLGVSESTVMYWCSEKVRQRVIRNSLKRWMRKSPEERREYARRYRERNREKYNYIMAKYYLRRLSPERREELWREVNENRVLRGQEV